MSGRNDQGGMYVGYLPLPARHRVFVAVAIPVFMLAFIGAAALIASAQRDPGDAVWDTAAERSWIGTLITDPYPILIEDDGTVNLLVEMGKRGGIRRRVLHAAPTRAEIKGYQLQRQGRRIIELAPGERAITLVSGSRSAVPPPEPLGPATVRGEIIDGKCFLGAMKPGDGKAHKACAVLCIEGGLPPMVAVREDPFDPTPDEILLLLVDGSTVLPPGVLDLVAQPVEITGTRSSLGTLGIIETSADRIRPLP